MKTINERIMFIRKELELSQGAFGERIGIKKSSVSLIEKSKNNPSTQTIKSICREFNVSYAWLVDGVGDVFIKTDNVLIDELAKEYDLNDLELRLIETFLKLNKENRKVLLDYLKNVFIPENDELK